MAGRETVDRAAMLWKIPTARTPGDMKLPASRIRARTTL